MTQALAENLEEELIGKLYKQSYYDDLQAVINEANAATSVEEALAAYERAKEAYNALIENADAYQNLQERNEY